MKKYAELDKPEEYALIRPMIEMPNPNAGREDLYPTAAPTMCEYRAWTISDVKSATADIPHPREGPEDCTAKLRMLADTFHPNAAEFETCVRSVLGIEWCLIAETWSALDVNNRPLKYAKKNEYQVRIEGLLERIERHFLGHADFLKISDCVQKGNETIQEYLERLRKVFKANSGLMEPAVWADNGPYAMQLKYAFMGGMRKDICAFVKKHLITWNLSGFNAVKQHAVAGEEWLRENKYAVHKGEPNRRGKPGFYQKKRGGERFEEACFTCGEMGHWSRDCQQRVHWERTERKERRE